MNCQQNRVSSEEWAELIRLIRRELRATGEIVLATDELAEFLGNGEPLDGVRVQELIRELASEHGWDSFVFDYGARVRFQTKQSPPCPPTR